jgi:uncharacterized membrane protein
MKARGSKIVENNKSRKRVEKSRERSVEYLAISCKVAIAFIIIFGMCRRECV